MNLNEILTPALLVDLDAMEGNLHKMANFFHDKPCKLRPHFKNHKCIALAKKQMEVGAIGISTATLYETEVLVEAGFDTILVANEITGEADITHLIALAARSEIIMAVDNVKIIGDIARLLNGRDTRLGIVADMDMGLKRCGLPSPQAALELAKKTLASGLRFMGLMGYEGHLQRYVASDESLAARRKSFSVLSDTKALLNREGIDVSLVSSGGTGTYAIAGTTASVTEVQAGNYLLMDTSYAPFATDFLPSLTLRTTVISAAPGERFVINTGIKEISAERGMPTLKGFEGCTLSALHAEHGIVTVADGVPTPEVGSVVDLNVYYSDGTVNLHRAMYGIRNQRIEEIFRIA